MLKEIIYSETYGVVRTNFVKTEGNFKLLSLVEKYFIHYMYLYKHNLLCKLDCRIKKVPVSRTDLLSSLFSFIKEVFLPQDFPKSVHPDYIPYQIWDTIQVCILCLLFEIFHLKLSDC